MASIRKIEGKRGIHYKIEVSNGYDVNGKKIRETTTFVPDPSMTKKQQERALQKFAMEFEDKVKRGNCIEGDKITLAEFTEKWFEDYAEGQLERTTLWRYRYVLDNNILPVMGHLKLSKIRPYDVQKFFVSLTKDDARQDGVSGGYSHESIRKMKTVLSSILSTAVKWEIIESNPCFKADLPKQDEAEEQPKAYSLDQTRRLLQFAENDYRAKQDKHITRNNNVIRITDFSNFINMDVSALQTLVLIHIAIFGGLRRGEMVGLDWCNVDFDKNIICVRQSAARTGKEEFVKTPKSKCSIRDVAFPQPVMDLLQELKREQERYKNAIGDKWIGSGDCVFIQMNGARMNISSPYDRFQRLVHRYNKTVSEDLQLPILSLHCLRHTNASLLVSSNRVDIVSVSKKLGHADANVTARYYLHSYEEGEQETADILGDLLLESRGKVAK